MRKIKRTNKVRKCVIILFLLSVAAAYGQTEQEKLTTTIKEFHQALVNKNTVSINQQTDKALSYGHSNGWVETKNDVIKDIETGYLVYNSYKEDSMNITINGSMANARFVADINATLNGNTNTFHLKVLEVWVKKGKRWLLFARQAVK
ncbi:MAG TPA: nuclear transport factor 2 family protein [Chitinophagaceae bacterium]|nr:nuclear transport factor 2 family protein [Chitinophagaceae bacterium]